MVCATSLLLFKADDSSETLFSGTKSLNLEGARCSRLGYLPSEGTTGSAVAELSALAFGISLSISSSASTIYKLCPTGKRVSVDVLD